MTLVSGDDDKDHGRDIELTFYQIKSRSVITPYSLVGMFDGRRPEILETGRDDGLRRE